MVARSAITFAAAHRRNKGHFISLVERPGAFAKLLIDRDQHRAAHLRKAREPRFVLPPEIANYRAVLQIDLLFGQAGYVARQPKKKYPNLHPL